MLWISNIDLICTIAWTIIKRSSVMFKVSSWLAAGMYLRSWTICQYILTHTLFPLLIRWITVIWALSSALRHYSPGFLISKSSGFLRPVPIIQCISVTFVCLDFHIKLCLFACRLGMFFFIAVNQSFGALSAIDLFIKQRALFMWVWYMSFHNYLSWSINQTLGGGPVAILQIPVVYLHKQ